MRSESVWLTVRKCHHKRIKQTFPRIMKHNNTIAMSDKENADIFAEFFQNEIYDSSAGTLPLYDQVTRQVNIIKRRIKTISNKAWKRITP